MKPFSVTDERQTSVKSSHKALISARFSDCTMRSSSADETVTYTMYPRRSKSVAIALVMGSCGEPATTVRAELAPDLCLHTSDEQHTHDLLSRPVASLSGLPSLAIQLLVPIEQHDSSSDEREKSRCPRAIPCHPVLHPIGQATRLGARGSAHRRAHSRWNP